MPCLRVAVAFFALCTCLAFAPTVEGVSNFHQVADHVYRGAQPEPPGFLSLARIGIKTVVDLREEPAQIRAEEQAVRAAGMRFVSVPMNGIGKPSDQQIAQALAVLNDNSAAPVFIHCRRGADRTGTVIACYRIAVDHWTLQQALVEARAFGLSFVERGMRHYIQAFQPSSETPVAATPAR